MSRVNAILVLLLAFSSICFGATLMQLTVTALAPDKSSSLVRSFDPSCQALIDEHKKTATNKMAKELYQEAFTLSSNGDWQKAQTVSRCASHLANGTTEWNVDARNLIK